MKDEVNGKSHKEDFFLSTENMFLTSMTLL